MIGAGCVQVACEMWGRLACRAGASIHDDFKRGMGLSANWR